MMGRAIAQIDFRLSLLGNRDRKRVIVLLKNSPGEQQGFTGRGEGDIRPALFGQLQIDT